MSATRIAQRREVTHRDRAHCQPSRATAYQRLILLGQDCRGLRPASGLPRSLEITGVATAMGLRFAALIVLLTLAGLAFGQARPVEAISASEQARQGLP